MKNRVWLVFLVSIAFVSCKKVQETDNAYILEHLFFEEQNQDGVNILSINGIPNENKQTVYYTDFSENSEEWGDEFEVINGRYPLTHNGSADIRVIDVPEIDFNDDYEIQIHAEFSDLSWESEFGIVFDAKEDSTTNNAYNVLLLSSFLDINSKMKILNINESLTQYMYDVKNTITPEYWSGMITIRKYQNYIFLFVDNELIKFITHTQLTEYYGSEFGLYLTKLSNAWLLDYKVSLIK